MSTKTEQCHCAEGGSAHAYEQVANIIDLYRDREGSLIQVLHLAQEIFGYLPLELQQFIARGMGIPLSHVSGVVSFYSFFATQPRGEHTIRVCMGTACYVRGGKKVVEHLMNRLGVDIGGTTADRRFSLDIARCIGSCGLAPAMMIDSKVYKQVNVNKIDGILREYTKEGAL